MKKKEFIKTYGQVAYEKHLQKSRDWKVQHCEEMNAQMEKYHAQHRDEDKARTAAWREANPEKKLAQDREKGHKGGKGYAHQQVYRRKGIQGKRNVIRAKHQKQYRALKHVIAPDSQLHHGWIDGTAKYTGVALVETEAHRHGIIKVIKVLEGKITLFRER